MVALCVCFKKANKAEEPKIEEVEGAVADGVVVEKKAEDVEEKKDGEEGAETAEVKVEVEVEGAETAEAKVDEEAVVEEKDVVEEKVEEAKEE